MGTKAKKAAKVEKLVCRYCGSDDLAPSFVKRRDRRCRKCFKSRYGSKHYGAAQPKKAKAPAKKAAKRPRAKSRAAVAAASPPKAVEGDKVA
jgi:hypothetical protein